jgi:hypothetical protein
VVAFCNWEKWEMDVVDLLVDEFGMLFYRELTSYRCPQVFILFCWVIMLLSLYFYFGLNFLIS